MVLCGDPVYLNFVVTNLRIRERFLAISVVEDEENFSDRLCLRVRAFVRLGMVSSWGANLQGFAVE